MEKDWKKLLTKEEFIICRQKGTEPAFSGKYNKFDEPGIYLCKCCKKEIFNSRFKYESGSGWPSFFIAIHDPECFIEFTNDTFFEGVIVFNPVAGPAGAVHHDAVEQPHLPADRCQHQRHRGRARAAAPAVDEGLV